MVNKKSPSNSNLNSRNPTNRKEAEQCEIETSTRKAYENEGTRTEGHDRMNKEEVRGAADARWAKNYDKEGSRNIRFAENYGQDQGRMSQEEIGGAEDRLGREYEMKIHLIKKQKKH